MKKEKLQKKLEEAIKTRNILIQQAQECSNLAIEANGQVKLLENLIKEIDEDKQKNETHDKIDSKETQTQ